MSTSPPSNHLAILQEKYVHINYGGKKSYVDILYYGDMIICFISCSMVFLSFYDRRENKYGEREFLNDAFHLKIYFLDSFLKTTHFRFYFPKITHFVFNF